MENILIIYGQIEIIIELGDFTALSQIKGSPLSTLPAFRPAEIHKKSFEGDHLQSRASREKLRDITSVQKEKKTDACGVEVATL